MRFRPHDYQQFSIDFILNHKTAALLLDMGLGGQNSDHADRHKAVI